jgi:hypothetical protein
MRAASGEGDGGVRAAWLARNEPEMHVIKRSERMEVVGLTDHWSANCVLWVRQLISTLSVLSLIVLAVLLMLLELAIKGDSGDIEQSLL